MAAPPATPAPAAPAATPAPGEQLVIFGQRITATHTEQLTRLAF